MRDSVFDSLLSISQFSSNDKFAEKYQRDPTLLPERDILNDQAVIEEKYVSALWSVARQNGENVAKKVDLVFSGKKSAADREDELNEIGWSMSSNIANVLTGLWVETWQLGSIHATRELDILDGKLDGKFSRRDDTAEFRELTDEERYFLAYPPDYTHYTLAPKELKRAVEMRTMKLANDIDFKTAERIRETVRYFVENRTNADGTMPIQARKDLVGQIGLAVGSGTRRKPLEGNYPLRSLEQIRAGVAAPNIPIEKRAGVTRSGEDPGDGLKKRLRTIARTELSAAYNTARLNKYQESGRVKYVIWNAVSDERLCDHCKARVGTVVPMERLLSPMTAAMTAATRPDPRSFDPRQYVLPMHPNDRCHWEPITEDAPELQDEDRTPKSRQATMVSKIGMAVGGMVKDRAKAAVGAAGTTAVRRIALGIAAAAEARSQERARQREQQKVFLATTGAIAATGTAVLGLGLLYQAIAKSGQTARTPRSVVQRREPIPLAVAIPSAIIDSIPELVADTLDVQTVTWGVLKDSGLKTDQIKQVMSGIDRVVADEVVPLTKKMAPQLLSPQLFRRFPQLADIRDLRNVTVDDLVTRYGVGSRSEADKLLDFIRRDLQNRIPEIPDVKVRNTPLTVDTRWQEIYEMLPVAMRGKRGESAAKAIVQHVRDSYAAGKPIRSLDELKKVKGVGKKTLDRLKSHDYVDNPNTLALGFLSDDQAADVLAGQLGLGPKLSKEIIQEIRDGGQYSDVENLIDRIEQRRRKKDGLMSQLNFGEREKKALRDQLGTRVYPRPNTTIGNARSGAQQQRMSLGNTSAYENQPRPLPSMSLPSDRVRELRAAADAAQAIREAMPTPRSLQQGQQTRKPATSALPAAPYVPPIRRRQPIIPGQRQLSALDRDARAARSAIDTYKGKQVYRQDKLFGKQETYAQAMERIDRELAVKQQQINTTTQRLTDLAGRINQETEALLDKAKEAEQLLKRGSDDEIDTLLRTLNIDEIEPTPNEKIPDLLTSAKLTLDESRDLLQRSRSIDATTAIAPDLSRSLKATGDTDLADQADKLTSGLGLREEELTSKIESIETLIAKLSGAGQSSALQDLAAARSRASAARDKIAGIKEQAQKQLARRRAIQPDGASSHSKQLQGVMDWVRDARDRRSQINASQLSWYRSSERNPDQDMGENLKGRLAELDGLADAVKRSGAEADTALTRIRRYKGNPADVDYVREDMSSQSNEARSLSTEIQRYRDYIRAVQGLVDGVPTIGKQAEAFQKAFSAETQAIDNGLKRMPKERALPTATPRTVGAIKELMEADRKARDLVAFWESRGFKAVESAASALDIAMMQWENNRADAYRIIGKQAEPIGDNVEAIDRVRKLMLDSRSSLVASYQPKIAEGLRLAREQARSVQERLQLLGGSAPLDSERYGLARRELLALEQKADLTPEEQRRAAELDREVRDRGMALYDRLLPESKQRAIAEHQESIDREKQRLAVREAELQSGVFRNDKAHRLSLEQDIAYLRRSISQSRQLIEQIRGVDSTKEESLFSRVQATPSDTHVRSVPQRNRSRDRGKRQHYPGNIRSRAPRRVGLR